MYYTRQVTVSHHIHQGGFRRIIVASSDDALLKLELRDEEGLEFRYVTTKLEPVTPWSKTFNLEIYADRLDDQIPIIAELANRAINDPSTAQAWLNQGTVPTTEVQDD